MASQRTKGCEDVRKELETEVRIQYPWQIVC